ncbi:hypothetical protein OUZ56_014931 [Daphnia magna]|uniref:Uncharacterized protein n=1 Tax=Daphnia magna TaxID=35525 RepID=A0ABR0ALA4_9CRUS|nr:hypothetical protein OUZ56_014931 [Daphnia magna]
MRLRDWPPTGFHNSCTHPLTLGLLHRHFFTLAARDYVEQLKVISKGTSCHSLLPSFVRKRLVSSDCRLSDVDLGIALGLDDSFKFSCSD